MSRFSLATALLSLFLIAGVSRTRANDSTVGPWSYLPVKIPSPLASMSVDMLTLNGNSKQSIILAGGCDSADGNVYIEDIDWAMCPSVTSKVSSFLKFINSLLALVRCVNENHARNHNISSCLSYTHLGLRIRPSP
jgi:hypothetical protein